MNISILDGNKREMEVYGKLCRVIGESSGYNMNIRAFSDANNFLFEMSDSVFLHATDIIIIDPQTGGEAIAQTLRRMTYKGIIVYLTNSDDLRFSIQAFDAEAFNFLKKGEAHILRFKKVMKQAMDKAEEMWNKFILLKNKDECLRLSLRDIYYFTALDHYITTYHDGGTFEMRATMSQLEDRLSGHGFVRTHKAYLVSVACILNTSRNAMWLADGTELPVGRTYYHQLQDKGVADNLNIITEVSSSDEQTE